MLNSRRGSTIHAVLITAAILLAVGLVAVYWQQNQEYRALTDQLSASTGYTGNYTGQEMSTGTVPGMPQRLTNAEIIQRVKPAVVLIRTESMMGSGFIIDSSGLVLTNSHVLGGATLALIRLTGGQVYVGRVIGRDDGVDLAVLKIVATGLRKLALGNSDLIQQGDTVFTLGYTLGLDQDASFRRGALSRKLTYEGHDYLEVSAPIYPGDSGSPLINSFGNVVGINTKVIAVDAKGIAAEESIKLAITSNTIKAYLPLLLAGRGVSTSTSPLPQRG